MTELDDRTKGRMIATLMSKKTKNTWRYYISTRRYKTTPGKRIFSDEQISELTGIPVNKLEKVASKWEDYRYGENNCLTDEQIAERLIKFANKHGRWPTLTELKNRKKNGKAKELPSWYSVTYNWSWRGYHNGIQNHIINEDKMFKKLKPKAILSIPNMTVRRAAMEKYGAQKLIRQEGKLIQQDDFGKLWELPTDNTKDVRSLYIEVVNSTKNEKGKFDHYFLRVKPDATTAAKAVASTFETEVVEFAQQT